MRMFLGVLLVAVTICAASAEETVVTFKTTDGRSFEGMRVVKVEPDAITCVPTNGVGGGKVLLKDLPEDMQAMFNYDPVKANAYAAAQRAKLNGYRTALMNQGQKDAQARKEKGDFEKRKAEYFKKSMRVVVEPFQRINGDVCCFLRAMWDPEKGSWHIVHPNLGIVIEIRDHPNYASVPLDTEMEFMVYEGTPVKRVTSRGEEVMRTSYSVTIREEFREPEKKK